MKANRQRVLEYLTNMSKAAAGAFPAYATIADNCGVSKRTAMRIVSELVELGKVAKIARKRPNGSRTSNLYKVFVTPIEKPLKRIKKHIQASRSLTPRRGLLTKYLKTFNAEMQRVHYRIKESTLSKLNQWAEKVESFYTPDQIEYAIDTHFDTLPPSNNGNVCAFMAASFRYFEIYPAK